MYFFDCETDISPSIPDMPAPMIKPIPGTFFFLWFLWPLIMVLSTVMLSISQIHWVNDFSSGHKMATFFILPFDSGPVAGCVIATIAATTMIFFPHLRKRHQCLKRKPHPPSTQKQSIWREHQSSMTGARNKFLLCLALQAAARIAADNPQFTLAQQRDVRKMVRSCRRNGVLDTKRLAQRPERLMAFRMALEEADADLSLAFNVIIDSGCTMSSTFNKDDFIPGTLRKLPRPLEMEGISGGLKVEWIGQARFEVQTTAGEIRVITTKAYYIPELRCRLFSPQAYLKELADPQDRNEFVLRMKHGVFRFADGQEIIAPYDPISSLPRFRAYHSALDSAKALAMKGCVTNEVNQNLTKRQKVLLRLHHRLGHINFTRILFLARRAWLGNEGLQLSGSTTDHPKCAACQYAKQPRTPMPSRHVKNEATGALSKGQLEPGDLIFSDQYTCTTAGLSTESRGMKKSLKYYGGTIFVDASSHMIEVHHQVGLTAQETIASKLAFERNLNQYGVAAKAYHSDNGIYTSRDFVNELKEKGQGQRLSGVSAQFQNGQAENAIKIVVGMARTMLLHARLRWPKCTDKELWPLAMTHAAYLYNRIPHQETGLSPLEILSKTKSDHGELVHQHVWGCPAYVLEPRLREGQKVPKWEPRSKRGQFLGASPLHASTVGLVRNLQSGSITPQYHVVYDDFFDTVHSSDDEEPDDWSDLVVFNTFRTDIENPPELAPEWLNAQELKEREERNKHAPSREGTAQPNAPQREPPDPASQREQTTSPQRETSVPSQREQQVHFPTEPTDHVAPAPTPPTPQPVQQPPTTAPPADVAARRSTRTSKPPDRLGYDGTQGRGYMSKVQRCAGFAMMMLSGSIHGAEYDQRYLSALLMDLDTGIMDTVHPMACQFPAAMKAKGNNPDLPTWDQCMTGEDKEACEEAMVKELTELSEHGTWELTKRDALPEGARVLPSTWAFRIKRYPDGRFRKFKARFCVRGDRQIAGIDYDEKYSPVVNWSTVRMMLSMAANYDLKTRQVDFSNAFVQAKLDDPIYVTTPRGFDAEGGNGNSHVLKLKRSLYGLVQAPLCWNNHLAEALRKAGFRPTSVDPCMYVNEKGMIILTYVDDCLFFHINQEEIDEVISNLRDSQSMPLTVEDDAFAFLGVEVLRDEEKSTIELKQTGLIDRVLNLCDMTDCNTKATPANQTPLGTDENGAPCEAKWEYASAVGMLMYLSSNSRPDIQFAVHQCARFTHRPRRSHELAILRICRYLKGTREHGLIFHPKKSMKLDCYVDADFAGLYSVEHDQDPVCVKSRTGYVITFGECPVLWVSKLQTEIALSTTEAEYIALSQAMRDLLPMRAMLLELSIVMKLKNEEIASVHSTVFEDNNGALTTAVSPRISPRTKHIAIKYHHFKSSVGADKGIIISPIDTTVQKADIFTKGLCADTFQRLRKLLMNW